MFHLKIDTLDKKPKVYNVAILTAAVLALLTVAVLLNREWMVRFCCLLLALYFLSVAVLLLRAFFLQIRYNLYSYNTIIYFGFALFLLSVSVVHTLLFVNLRSVPQEAVLLNLFSGLLGSAMVYMLLTFPFLFLFSLGLIVSNLSLIRHEGFRPVNLLGVILSVLLMGGEVLIYALNYYAYGSQTEVMLHDMFTNSLAAIYLYFECMMIGTITANSIAARYEPRKDKDYIMILGCAIRADGTPTPLLRGRLDRALSFARAQEAETGKAPIFVLSGGRGADECISEAECMRRYLSAQGVPEARMLLEDKSTDTAENMAFSKRLIADRGRPGQDGAEPKIAFSTTNYHVFRSGLKARRVKLRAQGMGCRSKWYFWPNASVREFIGLLTQHRIKQGLILLGMIASYVVMTLINYSL